MLQKEVDHAPSKKIDAASAFLASLEEPKLTSLAEAGKKPPIEILPPGMPSLSALITTQKKPTPGIQSSQQKPLQLEGPPTATPEAVTVSAATTATSEAPENASAATTTTSAATENAPPSTAPEAGSSPLPAEASKPTVDDKAPTSSPGSNSDQMAPVEGIPETIASDLALPPQIPDNQGASVPASTALPMSDALG